jgi:hypothetical protein
MAGAKTTAKAFGVLKPTSLPERGQIRKYLSKIGLMFLLSVIDADVGDVLPGFGIQVLEQP